MHAAPDLHVCVCLCGWRSQTYGDGTLRLTCEENVVFPNIPKEKVDAMLKEPIFQRILVSPGACWPGPSGEFCSCPLRLSAITPG